MNTVVKYLSYSNPTYFAFPFHLLPAHPDVRNSYYSSMVAKSLAVNITATAYYQAEETYIAPGFRWPSPYELSEEERQARSWQRDYNTRKLLTVWRSGLAARPRLPPTISNRNVHKFGMFPQCVTIVNLATRVQIMMFFTFTPPPGSVSIFRRRCHRACPSQ